MHYRIKLRYGHNDERIAGTGIITDEHAASSYGLPVVVSDQNGRAFGPGDFDRDISVEIIDRPPCPAWDAPDEDHREYHRQAEAISAWVRSGGWRESFSGQAW